MANDANQSKPNHSGTQGDDRSKGDQTKGGNTPQASAQTKNQDPQAKNQSQQAKNQGQQDANDAKERAQKAAGDAKEGTQKAAGDAKESAKEAAQHVADEAKDTARKLGSQASKEAHSTMDYVRSQARSSLDDGKSQIAQQISGVAQAFRSGSEKLREDEMGKLAEQGEWIAGRIEEMQHYLEDRSSSELLDDLRAAARARPALFIGSMIAAGVVAARFLHSSDRHEQRSGGSRDGARAGTRPRSVSTRS